MGNPRKHQFDHGPLDLERAPKRPRGGNDGHAQSVCSDNYKPLGHKDYKIGLICALEFEMSAIRYMLDEEHPRLPSARRDTNLYVLGNLSGHNVAIACLPGNQGKGAAATVATNMARTFPEIDLRVLVGIGGGVPSDRHDIRLGDVAIGMPDRLHSGVIQYDLGKDTEEAFALKGYLEPVPSILRSAIVSMQSDHRVKQNKVNEFLMAMLQKGGGLSTYRKPPIETDILFQVDSIHVLGQEGCKNCGSENVIPRCSRESNAPRIHYGLIASGDRVMRSARKSRLATQSDIGDVLCFEMEAAGILTEFPCLVIRGISDYADCHKNDIWQHYAAASAAGCAKEVLSHLKFGPSVDQREDEYMFLSSLGSISDEVLEISAEYPDMHDTASRSKVHKQKLLESLRFNQIETRKRNIKNSHSKTCNWLLGSPEYLRWLDNTEFNNHRGVLWIKGKPGAGKSTLMKFALADSFNKLKDRIVIHFFFNARGDYLEKSTVGMYRSLLWQLLSQLDKLLSIFDSDEILTWHRDEDHQWSIELLQELFRRAVQDLGQSPLVCFIDALDECEEQQIRSMLQFFEDIGESAANSGFRFHVLLSSRHYPHITIKRGLELVLEGQEGHSQDIVNYVESELKIGHGEIATQIKSEVRQKASGVFMWVVLVVHMLNKQCDRGRMYALRRELEGIPNDLHHLFRDIVIRGNDCKDEILLCIQWVLFARQPLSPVQLYCALLSDFDSDGIGEWNPEDITDEVIRRFIVDCSKGLAEITVSEIPTVQFIHESVRDFLLKENGLPEIWPDLESNFQGQSHEQLKKCCLKYITMVNISNYPYPDEPHLSDSTLVVPARGISVADTFPFLEYAVRNILYHADMAAGGGITQETFLQSFRLSHWNVLNNMFEKYDKRRHTRDVSLQYILAEYNLSYLIETCPPGLSWLETENERYGVPFFASLATESREAVQAIMKAYARSKPSESKLHELCNLRVEASFRRIFEFSNKRSVLSYIAELGDEIAMSFLLETGKFPPNSKDKDGRTPLYWAAEKGHEPIVKLLLADQRVECNIQTDLGTPLLQAAKNGHRQVVELLLVDQRADPNIRDIGGGAPLSWAAGNGHKEIIELLLVDQRVKPNIEDDWGWTPLEWAAQNGQGDIVKLLLAIECVEARAGSDSVPLLDAAASGLKEAVKLLADQCVGLNVQDQEGKPELSPAVSAHVEVVQLLLNELRIDLSVQDNSARTLLPLLRAAEKGDAEMINTLQHYEPQNSVR